MTDFDPTRVDDPWSALVVVVLILSLVVWPGINSHLARRHAREARDSIRHEAQPNSGSSMKDSLNRIEAEQERQGVRLTRLEQAAEKRGGLRWRRRP